MSNSPTQPRKKCRLEPASPSAPGPSSEVLPLISPNLIQKSSKDPNRGMYPRKRIKKLKKRKASPRFRQASELLELKDEESEDEDNVAVHTDSDEQDQIAKMNGSKFSGRKRKSRKSGTSGGASTSNKIINYFKPKSYPNLKKKEETLSSAVSHASSASSDAVNVEVANEKFFTKYYGLLGESTNNNAEDDRPNYFDRLPVHVMERIFCQIPFQDLMNYCRVCTAWNEVISDKKFMEWKKLYYGTKLRREESLMQMNRIRESLEISAANDCFKALIRYMAENFRRKPSSDMSDLLSLNMKAVDAKSLIVERFPEFLFQDSLPWCILTVAILLSETVWDVFRLYKCLFYSKSDCSLPDVTDAMYCIATFLLHFRDTYRINPGLHYRLYYTLYLIENNLPENPIEGSQTLKVISGLPGQQSIHSYSESSSSKLTYEQMKILNHRLQPRQIIKIIALAGTGKTTTLVHLAKLYPQMKFLNIMFNKAVCEHAKKIFPSNVTCQTAHSLAFAVYGKRLRHKLTSKVRPHDLVCFLEHYRGCSIQVHTYAKNVLSTLQKFMSSAALEISGEHTPLVFEDVDFQYISLLDRERIIRDAIQVWKRMIDKDDKLCKITHDVYLKLYQLTKPKLQGYHCIMVDEAQDCTSAMLDIVLTQSAPIILVGDPNQQIYGFRGATNALQNAPFSHTYYLTKSFRFGPQIAYIASCCLEYLRRYTTETLVGNTKPSYIDGRVEGQFAIIARSNSELLDQVIRLCCTKQRRSFEPHEIHGAFAGGIESYGLDQILDIYNLQGRPFDQKDYLGTTDKFISKFKSYTELENYAKNVEDNDLLGKLSLVRKYGSSVYKYINIVKEKCSHPMELANVIFTTAHKAKGLEFDTVCLTNDYNVSNIPRNDVIDDYGEESSILYVAATRAKRCLLLPDKLMQALMFYQEKFEYPVSSNSLMFCRNELVCAHCRDIFVPHTTHLLARRKILLSNGHSIPGGPLCMKCGTEPFSRPRIHNEILIMYLDPVHDFAHRSMSALVGPLPSDPPIEYEEYDVLHEAVLLRV